MRQQDESWDAMPAVVEKPQQNGQNGSKLMPLAFYLLPHGFHTLRINRLNQTLLQRGRGKKARAGKVNS